MDAHIGTPRPYYGAWRPAIEAAPDVERVLAIVREYLTSWSPDALALLPLDLASTALPAVEAIYARAFLARRAELAIQPEDPRHAAVAEMALVMATAAMRLTALGSLRSASEIRPANLIDTRQGGLRAEVRQKK